VPRNNQGFTLIELIVVIILVGIISVTASSRFSGMNSISAPVYRDQVISSLRLTQMRAMQTRDACQRWLLDGDKARQVDIEQPKVNITSCQTSTFPPSDTFWQDQTALQVDDSTNARFTLSIDGNASPLPFGLDFDNLGRINQCTNGCQITIIGSETLPICIEKEGYIHAC